MGAPLEADTLRIMIEGAVSSEKGIGDWLQDVASKGDFILPNGQQMSPQAVLEFARESNILEPQDLAALEGGVAGLAGAAGEVAKDALEHGGQNTSRFAHLRDQVQGAVGNGLNGVKNAGKQYADNIMKGDTATRVKTGIGTAEALAGTAGMAKAVQMAKEDGISLQSAGMFVGSALVAADGAVRATDAQNKGLAEKTFEYAAKHSDQIGAVVKKVTTFGRG
jgi:hypothetical protein